MNDKVRLNAFATTSDGLTHAVHARQHLVTRFTQAESFSRPLRRRVARIERPARVRIRRRKPCFLARRRLFG